MKRAVSISIGSSKRDKSVEIQLLGERVRIERIGTDGDMEKAAQLYKELDGQVDAFGVGGADLGLLVDGKWYPLYSVQKMVRFIEKTPYVDGAGLKNSLENRAAPFLEKHLKDYLDEKGRRAFLVSGGDRWGLSQGFVAAGYETIFGDLMFGLGLPIPLRSLKQLKWMAALFMPIAGRLPFEWLYPTGSKQEARTPKWEKYYRWATVIAGDCHYIRRHIPDDMEGKIIVTNTTTPADQDLFRRIGIKYLVTTTPMLDGRSFGTNMMEAALVAAAGKGRRLTVDELNALLDELRFEPQLHQLN